MSVREALTNLLPCVPRGSLGVLARHFGRLAHGQLLLSDGDGKRWLLEGQHAGLRAHMSVFHPLRLLLRLAARGEIGFAEGYMDGDWQTVDLPRLLALLHGNLERSVRSPAGLAASRWRNLLLHRLRANTRRGSRRNIARHYDLGNDFYRLWLDRGMSYSCALFEGTPDEPLEQAQQRKYRRLLEALGARPGDHILEIGCGWGGFALLAAQRGYRVTAITLSQEQLAYARRRLVEAGVSGRVELRLQDYRETTGCFDHVVSIEMIEGVGEAYWPVYFDALRHRVRPGGRIALQAITIDEARFQQYRQMPDFIQLYIFPGGMLPSAPRLVAESTRAGLQVLQSDNFGAHYAETLRRWRRRFIASTERLATMGYDGRFRRMWDYYLAYCQVGFEIGPIDLTQTVLAAPKS